MTADAWVMGSGAPTVINTAAMPSVASDASPKTRAMSRNRRALRFTASPPRLGVGVLDRPQDGVQGGDVSVDPLEVGLHAGPGLEGVARGGEAFPLLPEGGEPGVPGPGPRVLKFLGFFHAALLSFSSPGWYNRAGLLPREGVDTNEGFSV